ncbi:hypothetical protein RUM44_010045 [Polyplax serrata]|uniref:Uncharacterized protein n=1 Tax=Polyplax serrata TaxID=468196 RepID=A0ABR1AUG0_POLSC
MGHVKEKRGERETYYDDFGAGHSAHGRSLQRVPDGYEPFDSERDHEPNTEKTAHGGQVDGELANNRLVEYGYVYHVQPRDEEDHEKTRVAYGQGSQVETRGEFPEFGREEDEDGEQVADGAESHEEGHVVKLDLLEDSDGTGESLVLVG